MLKYSQHELYFCIRISEHITPDDSLMLISFNIYVETVLA